MVTRTQMRFSGSVLNRIDIHMQVPRMEYHKLREMRLGESSADVRARLESARDYQRVRFVGTDIASNAAIRPAQIRKYCVLDETCQVLIKTAMCQLQQTARAIHCVLKLSGTLASLVKVLKDRPKGKLRSSDESTDFVSLLSSMCTICEASGR